MIEGGWEALRRKKRPHFSVRPPKQMLSSDQETADHRVRNTVIHRDGKLGRDCRRSYDSLADSTYFCGLRWGGRSSGTVWWRLPYSRFGPLTKNPTLLWVLASNQDAQMFSFSSRTLCRRNLTLAELELRGGFPFLENGGGCRFCSCTAVVDCRWIIME